MSRTLGIVVGLGLVAGATEHPAAADAPKPASAAPRIKVAVVPGIAVNMEPARVDALAQDLATSLSAELEVEATGGLEVRRALPPEGVPPDCVTTPSCVADVARRTGATQLLFVVMVDSGSGGSIQIDSTWVEPATGQSAARPAVDITTVSEARARFSAAAHGLLPDAPIRPKAKTGGGMSLNETGGKPRHLTTPALITAGVAVVGIGGGIAFGLQTRSKYNACDATPAMCSSSQRDTIRHEGLAADAGWLVAIGGAIATSVIFATSGEEPRFIVSPTADGAAVTAFGRF